MQFCHLHVHSEYSIGDGLFSPRVWAESFADAGFKGAALTDHGTMGGSLEFYHAMRKLKLKPIMGCEFYFNAEPERKTADNRKCQHVVLLAKNNEGWKSLLALQHWSYTDGFYFKPRIGFDQLEGLSENLVCTTACVGGILGAGIDDYVERYMKLRKLFGDDLYIEFQGHDFDLQREINQKLIKLPGIEPIITSDCHFILKEHQKLQKIIKSNAFSNAEAAESYAAAETNYMASARDIYMLFQKHHSIPKPFVVQGLRNTEFVFEKCNVELEEKRYLPLFSEKYNSRELFLKLTKKALAEFLKDEDVYEYASKSEYIERFTKEARVILKYNLEDYFLIVWDILRFARKQGIYTGLARGSSAGSFICFLLKITQINPLQYNLIFERFLNEMRCEHGELPDVDTDFEVTRRHEIKEYVIKKYGSDKVCEIGVYGRLKLKSSIIDFGKQFGFSHAELLAVTTKLDLEKDDAQSLEAAMKESPQLEEFMRRHPDYAWAVDSLNGQIKSQSIHPAGVIVCSDSVHLVTPVKTQKSSKTKDRVLATQSEDSVCLAQGLIKLDLLGIKEYDIFKSVIENADTDLTMETYVDVIHRGASKHEDPEVWEMLQRGQTEAVFQLSSPAMKSLLIEIKPDCIDDLMAAVALYRPGCIENGWHILYYKRKRGEEDVEYGCSELEEILKSTYGIPVYQEQVMEICNKVGEIPLTKSDIIRSALGKKDLEKLKGFKVEFVAGASSKLGGTEAAEAYWDQIEKSAGYLFNRSHSAAYSLVAYISQYFKVKYPAYFWSAVLDFDARKNQREKLSLHRQEAVFSMVKILNPEINKSKESFYVETSELGHPTSIRWSFNGIKSVGVKTAEEIVRCQPYSSFDDFYNRVNKAKVKFDAMLNLAYAGAFDEWYDRCTVINIIYELHNGKKTTKEKKRVPALSNNILLYRFYEMLGYFEERLKKLFDGFPLNKKGRPLYFIESEIHDLAEGSPVIVGGMLMDIRAFKTKKGEAMGSAKLIDLNEEIEVTFFPKTWGGNKTKIKDGNIVLIHGSKSTYNNRKNLINANTLEVISSFKLPT